MRVLRRAKFGTYCESNQGLLVQGTLRYTLNYSFICFVITEFYAVMPSASAKYGGIITPGFPEGIYRCFRFSYHMFGNTMGTLEVDALGNQETKFTKTGMARIHEV